MKVSVIVLTWNQKDYTINCLKSLAAQDYKDFETIVVDNASTDGTAEAVRERFPHVRLVINSENLGFCGGNNSGVKIAGPKSEVIVLLNNDTIVKKSWLSGLLKAFDDPKVGVAVSRIFDKYGARKFYTNDFETMSLLGYNVNYKPKDANADFIDTFYACGCSLAYRRSLFNLPFDEDYFIYYEDVYLSWLSRLKGFLVKKARKSMLYHFGNVAMKRISGRKAYLQERNRLMNFLVFHSRKDVAVLLPWYLLSILFHNLYDIRASPFRLKGYLWCLVHPLRIIKKRVHIQKQRKVPFSDITCYMSCKFYEESNINNKLLRGILILINRLSCLYCRIFRINAIESC